LHRERCSLSPEYFEVIAKLWVKGSSFRWQSEPLSRKCGALVQRIGGGEREERTRQAEQSEAMFGASIVASELGLEAE
jgi:hypothetical protein